MADFKLPIDVSLQKWADITIYKFQRELARLKVGVTNELMFSFSREVIKANGDVQSVVIKFLRYGRFVDMGVGAGVPIGELKLVRQFDIYKDVYGQSFGHNLRRPKKWYSKILYTEIAKLKYILPQEIAPALAERIRTDLEKMN
ncbi:MAG: hypothetical protein INR69_14890 [Mucilaginibacter polytrichastri]|nr:hypothetical protein [Mucilaginibacter polytrichastri]